MKTYNPHVAIVIVTWNNEKDIKTCIDSLFKSSYKNISVIVVDNASTDATCKVIKENYKAEVHLIKLPENLYLTGGNNIGIQYALDTFAPEYTMVLNPDTQVDKNALNLMVKTASKSERIGAVGPKLVFFNNHNAGLINSAGIFYDGFAQAYDRGFMDKDEGQWDKEEKVFGVSGACILYKSKMLSEIGLYWIPIRMYLDEVEMFIRAQKRGWSVVFNGEAVVYHSYMKSTNSNKLFRIEKQKLKAWMLIALRHYSLKGKFAMARKYFFNLFS